VEFLALPKVRYEKHQVLDTLRWLPARTSAYPSALLWKCAAKLNSSRPRALELDGSVITNDKQATVVILPCALRINRKMQPWKPIKGWDSSLAA
jgi:hypothetical protein